MTRRVSKWAREAIGWAVTVVVLGAVLLLVAIVLVLANGSALCPTWAQCR
jgi:hypothetical protein